MEIKDTIRDRMLGDGYRALASNRPEFTIFYKSDGQSTYLVHLVNAGYNFDYDAIRLQSLISEATGMFESKGYRNIYSHVVVLTDDINIGRRLIGNGYSIWVMHRITGQIIIYENQPADFGGIRRLLENVCAGTQPGFRFAKGPMPGGRSLRQWYEFAKVKLGVVTLLITLINIVVFLFLSLLGNTESASFMYEHGALLPTSLQDGEAYRLLTSIFLHFGASHLGGNMVVLCIMGSMLERNIGSIYFSIIYFVSGIGANIISCQYYLATESNVVAAGASGAIFGVIGALVVVVIMNRGRLVRENLTTRKIVIFAVLSLFQGFTSSGVDNTAHVAGVIIGAITAFICTMIHRSFVARR